MDLKVAHKSAAPIAMKKGNAPKAVMNVKKSGKAAAPAVEMGPVSKAVVKGMKKLGQALKRA